MSKAGRPRALDDAKRREICALISAGAGIRAAAQYVGCSRSTVYREAQNDVQFREQLRRAKAANCLTPLQALRQSLQSNWRAAAWMLERTDPEQFGRSYRHAFGRRELNALARDLIAVVRDEVDHPVQRERVIRRMRAMINYAMRHAWDKRRSGKALDRAMRHFENNNPQDHEWTDEGFDLDFPASKQASTASDDGNSATLDGLDFAKCESLDELLDEISTRIPPTSDDHAA